jgi:predicted Zn-dependent protease
MPTDRATRRRVPSPLRRLRAAAWLALAGCATNPVTGRPEVLLVSTEQEKEAGRQAAQQVEAELGVVAEGGAAAEVRALGERIARVSPYREVSYSFFLVDMEEPNAFALPGGYVYVSRGLLALTNSEDELAGALAHEVAHVAARHHARLETRATGVGILTVGPALVSAILGGPALLRAPFDLLGGGLIAAYGREQEREADRVGQGLAAAAGFDPAGLPRLLASLERAERESPGGRRRPSFFDTHPTTPERVTLAEAEAGRLAAARPVGAARERGAFLRRLEGLRVGKNPAEGVFEGRRFLHPDLGFALQFPEGWEVLNTRAAVGALEAGGQARVVLELEAAGDDPVAAGRAFLAALAGEVSLSAQDLAPLRVNGLAAARARTVASGRGASLALHLTWVAHRGHVYRMAGAAEPRVARGFDAAFESVAGSFRPLLAEEREGITDLTLRLVAARAGERLAELHGHSASAWSVEQIALANALAPEQPLAAGALVKIARREAYRGQPASPRRDP